RRQVGRASVGGCGNELLSQIMQHVVGPLQLVNRMKLGDIAHILQQSVQQATGQSHEILMGKGDMVTASHQMSQSSHCRMRIGEYYTTVYATPVAYAIGNTQQEKELSNTDFGEKNGRSSDQSQCARGGRGEAVGLGGLGLGAAAGSCFSGDLIVETKEGPKLMSELKTGDEMLSIDDTM
ncbi:hypothetical protein PENTCL1PPCAC_8723, partial [Pristionchus entomophagus]